ncbi:MAG: peptidylprolyl isomerase [Clostridia bacterium]|nr:peptidylprolyl isomerase [Clostridia bacterium]
MAKEKLTEAEQYRLERKKRIEKEKKKKNSYFSRNHEQVQKTKKIVGITVAVCVCVVVVCFFLNYFGVFNRMLPAAKVDGTSVSVAEMNCAFADIKNMVYNQSQQYEQSGQQSFYTQETKSTDTCVYDQTKTWGEYFEEQALEHIKQIYAYKDAEGNTLTEDQIKEIDETFSTLSDSAEQNKYSLNAYIREVYGIGVNQKVLRTWLENVYKAQNAQTAASDTYKDKLSDEEISKYYNENKQKYTTASVMAYTLRVDTTEVADKLAEEGLKDEDKENLVKDSVASTKKNAEALYKQIKDNPDNFVQLVNAYEKKQNKEAATEYTEDTATLTGKISETMTALGKEAQLWVANSKSVNQSDVIYTADYDSNSFQFDIVVVKEPAENYNTVAVRHILIQPSDTNDETAWKEAKEEIETIEKQWKKNATEDYFSELAKEKSTDPGSKEKGGLYDSVVPGQMETTFNDWCFDSSRKPGDSGIIKTSYGYHLMYFVKDNGAYWKTQVPTDMASEYSSDVLQAQLDEMSVEKVSLGWNKIKEVQDYKDAQKLTTTTATTAAETTAAE